MRRIDCTLVMLCVSLIIGSAGASDYTLEIFGNANMDGTIDEKDIAYVEGIIKGANAATNLSDANYDGIIDPLDVEQVEKIISGEETKLVLLDSASKIVTIKMPVEKIIPLNRHAAEALKTIKASDRIVGVSDAAIREKSYFPEFQDIQCVGSASSPDFEKVFSLNPDLVIYYGGRADYETINETIKTANPEINVIGLDCYKPETCVEDITKLGYIVGNVEEAKEFTNWYNENMDKIQNIVKDIPEEEKPRIYESNGAASTFYRTGGFSSTPHNLIVMAGGKNIFEDMEGDATVDPEALVERDPQFIVWKITEIGGYSLEKGNITKFEEIRKGILDRPELVNVSAIKNDNVYILSKDVFFGGRYFLSIAYMAKWFHPDLFKDLDPEAIHQEYLTRFQHLDYDLVSRQLFNVG